MERGAKTPSPYLTGVLGRCPACGRGSLFKGFIELAPACRACGQSFSFADSGDGPAVFVILAAGGLVCAIALWVDVVFDPPLWLVFLLILPLTLVVCLGLLRPFKGLLVALQFTNKAEESRWRP
jgi:uncharacterized protein (DUF983 family)